MWWAVLSVALLAGCGSTPTLPLPPPVSMLGAPDPQGLVTVQGEANEDAYVTVLNEQTDSGKITHAAANGHFSLQIAASVGDTLVIWQEADGVAGERTEQTVPGPQTR
ncbi:MAG: hypothetical protein JWN04_5353 [Myxococcaceae bacterium]|nr:hypothetical protein [Myxococcaceae bacterium]